MGDVAGVRIIPAYITPPTPPPDIDLEAWQASLDLVAAWEPSRLALTHFGTYDDVDAHLERLRGALAQWGELAQVTDARRTRRRAAGRCRARVADPETAAFDGQRGASRTAVGGPRSVLAQEGRAGGRGRMTALRSAPVSQTDRASSHGRPGQRPGRALARDRPQRRPQHVRRRRAHAGALRSRASASTRATAIADRIHSTGLAIVWTGHHEAAEQLLGAAARRGADDGPARAGLSRAASARGRRASRPGRDRLADAQLTGQPERQRRGPRAIASASCCAATTRRATPRARDQLAEEMLPLARALAGRYTGRGEPLDDLVQVACVGIMKAIDGFDLVARGALLVLRDADRARRDQAPLPRQDVGDARPARDAGAADRARQGARRAHDRRSAARRRCRSSRTRSSSRSRRS